MKGRHDKLNNPGERVTGDSGQCIPGDNPQYPAAIQVLNSKGTRIGNLPQCLVSVLSASLHSGKISMQWLVTCISMWLQLLALFILAQQRNATKPILLINIYFLKTSLGINFSTVTGNSIPSSVPGLKVKGGGMHCPCIFKVMSNGADLGQLYSQLSSLEQSGSKTEKHHISHVKMQ